MSNHKKKVLVIGGLFCFFSVFSQENDNNKTVLFNYQDTLVFLQNKMYKERFDAGKIKTNNVFIALFKKALLVENSFSFNFDSLTSISRLVSPDKTFKIYNWNIPKDDGTHAYFGFIQTFNEKSGRTKLYPLIDKSEEVKYPSNYSSDNEKWFGMLYYKIIPCQYKKRKFYTLLAWDGNDKLTTKKIIDVLYFVKEGVPHFGDVVFELGKRTPKRVIFEYSSEATMSLKYDEKTENIVFDHLSAPSQALEGHYEFYGPDMSYDALQFKKGKWVYIADIDARNSKGKNDKLYNNPKNSKPENLNK